MDHGFRKAHFDLLRRWGSRRFDRDDPAQAQARSTLEGAWLATEAWAKALQARMFPLGRPAIRKSPINQGKAFTPYTWAKIYPSPSAPKALAYTVGIDEDRFVVKIDTVGDTVARSAYLALRGEDNAHSPFGAVLPSGEGLELSFEKLVEWSVEAIRSFRMTYDEVLLRIGLGVPKLTLLTDEAESRGGFAAWREALMAAALKKGALYWLPEGGIVLRPTRSDRSAHSDGMDLGLDPTGRTWAVQINEPRIAGNHNSLSSVAIDVGGERFLLRQGFLRPNEPGGRTISGDEFIGRSGLVPVPVEAEGLAARRIWFKVCSLDSTPEEMRRATSVFVDRCAEVRASAEAEEPPAPPAEPPDLFSRGESGGSYTRRARPAQEERLIRLRQGTVWLALAELLVPAGIRIRKGRHPLGYEVDAEIDGAGIDPLLVEIKTGLSAGDIHSATGQLHLYPRLIPRLASYERALLLPGMPPAEVRSAIEACGIAIHTYDLDESGDEAVVTFSPHFLGRCGLRDR